MARRSAGKANPRSVAPRGGGRRVKAKLTAPTSAPPACEATLPETALHKRLAALERERDTLRTALEQERARRLALEKVHAATRDRISWALDSLQAILDARA